MEHLVCLLALFPTERGTTINLEIDRCDLSFTPQEMTCSGNLRLYMIGSCARISMLGTQAERSLISILLRFLSLRGKTTLEHSDYRTYGPDPPGKVPAYLAKMADPETHSLRSPTGACQSVLVPGHGALRLLRKAFSCLSASSEQNPGKCPGEVRASVLGGFLIHAEYSPVHRWDAAHARNLCRVHWASCAAIPFIWVKRLVLRSRVGAGWSSICNPLTVRRDSSRQEICSSRIGLDPSGRSSQSVESPVEDGLMANQHQSADFIMVCHQGTYEALSPRKKFSRIRTQPEGGRSIADSG